MVGVVCARPVVKDMMYSSAWGQAGYLELNVIFNLSMIKLYAKIDRRFVPLFKASEDEGFSGLCFIKDRNSRPPQIILEIGNRINQLSDNLETVNILVLFGRKYFSLKERLYSELYEEISESPSQFMMKKVFEGHGINVFACYHPHLLPAIANEGHGDLREILLKDEETRQKVLNGALWRIEDKRYYLADGIIPYSRFFRYYADEPASVVLKTELVHRGATDEDYYVSTHPFYSCFLTVANFVEGSLLLDFLNIAKNVGLDAAHLATQKMLNKLFLERKSIKRLAEVLTGLHPFYHV